MTTTQTYHYRLTRRYSRLGVALLNAQEYKEITQFLYLGFSRNFFSLELF